MLTVGSQQGLPVHPQRRRAHGPALPPEQRPGKLSVLGQGGVGVSFPVGKELRLAAETFGHLHIHGRHPAPHRSDRTSAPRSTGPAVRSGSPSGASSASPATPPATIPGCCGASRSDRIWRCSSAATAGGGEVRGTVQFRAADGGVDATPPQPIVVYLTGFRQPPLADAPAISQKDKTFLPDLRVIVAGQSVQFTNDDPFVHNVFSTSTARDFDLGSARATRDADGELPQPRAWWTSSATSTSRCTPTCWCYPTAPSPASEPTEHSSSVTFPPGRHPAACLGTADRALRDGGGGRRGPAHARSSSCCDLGSSTPRTSTSSGGPTRSGPATRHDHLGRGWVTSTRTRSPGTSAARAPRPSGSGWPSTSTAARPAASWSSRWSAPW